MSDEVEGKEEITQEQSVNEEETKTDEAPQTIIDEDQTIDTEDKHVEGEEHPDDKQETEEGDGSKVSGDKNSNSIQDCSICKKQLIDPKTLPCIHSFCTACLKDHVEASEDENPTCPVCSSSIPDGNLEVLPVDPLVEKVLKCTLKDGDEQCTLCSSNATQRCTNCEHFLCARDAEQHRLIPATKEHECMEIDEYQKLSIKDRLALQILYCSVHPNTKVEVYCKLCDVFICMACNVVEHQRAKHDIEPVANYIDRLTPKLKKVADELQKQSDISDENVCKVNQAIGNLQPLKEQASADIQKLCSEMREKIDKCEQELNEQLDEKYKQKSDAMNNLLCQMNGNSLQVKSIIEYIDCLIGSRNCELLRHATFTHINSFEKTLKNTKHAGKVVNVTDVLNVVIDEKKVEGISSDKLCCFKISDASPDNTSFSRVTDAKTGEPKSFTVTSKNEDGKPSIADPAPTVEIIDTDKKVIATPTLESHKNGTYQYSWIPKMIGTFGVRVCIGKKQIKGSPFKLMVLKGAANKTSKNGKKPPTNSKKVR